MMEHNRQPMYLSPEMKVYPLALERGFCQAASIYDPSQRTEYFDEKSEIIF
ncbi:MAG: hypothetical protein IJU13_01345 [Bacteroidales bacterium]|nr:hypothetical protein [Bacteroidales bacterium]